MDGDGATIEMPSSMNVVKVYKMQMQGTLAYSGGSLAAREFEFDDDFDE